MGQGWVEMAALGEWQVQVVPWPRYTEKRECWWTVRLKHEDTVGGIWLAWNGYRLAGGKESDRARRNAPHLIAPLLALLTDKLSGEMLR